MASDYLWYIIPRDGAYPWEPEGTRAVDFDYLKHLATGVDRLGFSGALLATDIHDVWVLGSALAAHTKKLRPLLAVHPGLISPTLLAKMALTFDDLFDGRLQINVVNGETRTLKQYGLEVEHDERYALAGEYWEIFRRLTSGEVVDFEGHHYSVRGAGSNFGLPVVQKPHVPLWFGGSSEAGMQMAAKHIDRYLSWGEPPARVAEKIARLNELAEGHGRTIGYGMRLHLVVRDTEQEAWDHVDHLLKATSDATYARMAASNAGSDSVGMQRQFEKHQGQVPDRAKDLESYPNIWPGMSLLRPGPGTALVGSTEQVVERIQEFEALGVDTFILSGNPLLEEAYRVSETVLPQLGVRPDAGVRARDHQAIVDVPVTAG
ncbi:Alkanesulfonate monooxygenase [Baekduia alba]|uniref:LLM class flavin-dependent oxidoreductase n=1 Tax=Baekduia alba TaxID=2997333 RepID=UPI002341268C|nr:LLM class flavin-dependent oxidoreductase [Baekduia alba]WCB96202.1 Alkanesulfonate monooxygenase [Baekduia alba]